MNTIKKAVHLYDVTHDDGQEALDCIETIYDAYELPDSTREKLWHLHCVLTSDVLIRFSRYDPDVGYPERNGHA